jgi:hypothetical protein
MEECCSTPHSTSSTNYGVRTTNVVAKQKQGVTTTSRKHHRLLSSFPTCSSSNLTSPTYHLWLDWQDKTKNRHNKDRQSRSPVLTMVSKESGSGGATSPSQSKTEQEEKEESKENNAEFVNQGTTMVLRSRMRKFELSKWSLRVRVCLIAVCGCVRLYGISLIWRC